MASRLGFSSPADGGDGGCMAPAGRSVSQGEAGLCCGSRRAPCLGAEYGEGVFLSHVAHPPQVTDTPPPHGASVSRGGFQVATAELRKGSVSSLSSEEAPSLCSQPVLPDESTWPLALLRGREGPVSQLEGPAGSSPHFPNLPLVFFLLGEATLG